MPITNHNFTNNPNPPANSRRIMRVADMPQERGPAQYEIINCEQKPCVFIISKRQSQVLDLLISAPTYCARPVRIGGAVHIMKREIGLGVETKFYPGNPTHSIRQTNA